MRICFLWIFAALGFLGSYLQAANQENLKILYRQMDAKTTVSLKTGTIWKIIPVVEPLGTSRTSCTILGDGWHEPSFSDFSVDKSHVQEAIHRDELANACICGNEVSRMPMRRSRRRCHGFYDADATRSQSPEESDVITFPGRGVLAIHISDASAICRREAKRLPTGEEMARLHDRLSPLLGGVGCVWTDDKSSHKDLPYEIWSLNGYEGEPGPKYANDAKSCFAVCVL